MKRIVPFILAALLAACTAPRAEVPPLTPQAASALLEFDNKAHNHLQNAKKENPSCDYKLDLPDQANHPSEIDLDHIVSCGGRPAPKEFDASVVFEYDKTTQRWTVGRFSS